MEKGKGVRLPSVLVIGWIDTKVWEETGDEQAAQGWCPTIIDTNGDGRITEWVGLRHEVDPAKDKHVGGGWYGIVPDPTEDNFGSLPALEW